jgi:hypothetical protein
VGGDRISRHAETAKLLLTARVDGYGLHSATTARELLGDAILKLVVTKGVDVLHVEEPPETLMKP